MLKTVSSSSGGNSGFPFTLGNTIITSQSTTTTLSNLTLNNVIINGTTENNVSFSNVNVLSGNIANVTISNATVVNANITSVATTFPNSFLANSFTTLGNSTLTLGNSTSSVGNLTLGNANITSVASTFPNSYLANSTATLGNTTITLGSTTSTVGNLTLANVTITGGTISDNTVTANSFVGTGNILSSSNIGVFSYGNLSYSDTGIVASYASSVNSYVQIVAQNLSNANQASTDFTVVNDTGTAYGDFGITSSTYSGTGRFYNSNVVYAYSGNADLVIGTITNNAVHFVGNNSTTDAMTLNGNNTITINAVGATFPNSYLSNSTATLGNATITLGSTTSNVGNLTLSNVTITSGNVTINAGTQNVQTINHTATTNANATMSTASIPLVPQGYMLFDLNGTVVKIPYYAV